MLTPQETTPIERMVSMNNHGVHLLGEGHLFFARQAFYRAADLMHDVLDQQEQELSQAPLGPNKTKLGREIEGCFLSLRETASAPLNSSDSGFVWEADTPVSQCPVQTPAQLQTHKHSRRIIRLSDCDSDNDNASLYSFLRPILFSQNDFVRATNPPLMQISVCILFNLAVANHTIALDVSSNQTDNMQQNQGPVFRNSALEEAIYMYQLAYGLQLDANVEVSGLHTLGMINNVGRLHAHAGNAHESKACFENLLKLLLLEQTRRSLGHHQFPMLARYTELFFDNVFRIVLCNSSKSSPAA